MKITLRHIVFFVFLIIVTLPAEAQCAMCRAVLESEDGGHAAKGINNGIIYLMTIPYLLIAAIGFAIYRSRKKLKDEHSE